MGNNNLPDQDSNKLTDQLRHFSKLIHEKPIRFVYELVLLSAAISIIVRYFKSQEIKGVNLIFPIFFLIVLVLLILVTEEYRSDPSKKRTSTLRMIYAGTGLCFVLMALVVVLHFFDEILSNSPREWLKNALIPSTSKGSDLSPRFYGRYNLLGDIKHEFDITQDEKTRAPQNVDCELVLHFHYIEPEMQIGFRGYMGLQKHNSSKNSSFIIKVAGDTESTIKKLNFIFWPTSSLSSKVRTVEIDPKTSAHEISFDPQDNKNIAWFNLYDDPATSSASWFFVPLDGCEESRKNPVLHFVAIKKKHLEFWNPNKSTYRFSSIHNTLDFSNDTFIQLDPHENKHDDLKYLRELLSNVVGANFICDVNERTSNSDGCEKRDRIQENMKSMLVDNKISSDHVIFLNKAIRQKGEMRVLLFRFPQQ